VVDLVLSIKDHGEWAVVHIEGEVDVASAPTLRERLVDLVSAGRHRLAVDLTDVSFLDSVGLGVLIGGVKRARAQGGDLVLVAPSGGVERVLDLTGLLSVIKTVPSLDDLDQPVAES
jgi:anti-sigma B factor antagonist